MVNSDMKIFNDDIFLVSYPRSGNTWMRYLIANLLYPNEYWHLNNISDVVPDIYEIDVSKYSRPRIIKSHEPYTSKYSKVIYMYRDGRDVAISYYNLCSTAYGYRGSFPAFLKQYLLGGKIDNFGTWKDHVSGWLEHESENILFIQYEIMCTNTANVVLQILSFLNVGGDEVRAKAAIDKCTLDIQRADVQRLSPHYAKGFRGGVKGGPGMWRDIFTPEMNDMFWSYAGDLMSRLGYERG